MQFKIKNQTLSIKHNQLTFDDQIIELNDKTKNALLLFLNSKQAVISKDHFLEKVWLGVIVSDASIFKQIQTLRNLFVQAGLPEDSIENVYGKGYRLKYTVSAIIEPTRTEPEHAESVAVNHTNKRLTIGLLMALVTSLFFYYFWQQQQQTTNKLNKEQRSAITELSKNDWQQGRPERTGV